MKTFLRIILSFSIVLFFTSCDDKLTRDEAKEQIISGLSVPFDEIKPFKVDDNTYSADRTANQYKQLKEIGLLDYSFEGDWPSQYHAKAILNDKGNKYVVSEERDEGYFNEVDVKVARVEFGEVTGIQEIKLGEMISYYVEYTIIRKEVTPFGKILYDLKEKTIKKKVKFSKYDDGWRVSDTEFKDLKEALIFNFDNAENELF
ncbi:hypothetical protein ABGT15_02740 [Flavobacterium enshiense]|uniref:hypothetical protein n=1 Tax=Flavobacterium enshiense TaxID=1341165 RepID=UPI00345CD1EB